MMSTHDRVLRATAFHALAACYEDHRPLEVDEYSVVLRASEELPRLRAELARAQERIGELQRECAKEHP